VRNVGVVPVGFLNTEEYAFKNPDHQHRPMVERPLVREGPRGVPEVYGWETYEWSIPTQQGASGASSARTWRGLHSGEEDSRCFALTCCLKKESLTPLGPGGAPEVYGWET